MKIISEYFVILFSHPKSSIRTNHIAHYLCSIRLSKLMRTHGRLLKIKKKDFFKKKPYATCFGVLSSLWEKLPAPLEYPDPIPVLTAYWNW